MKPPIKLIAQKIQKLKRFKFTQGYPFISLFFPGGVDENIINNDLLVPLYDYDFRNINDTNKKFYRGGLEFKRPCGWKRYAIKVKDKYENDKCSDDQVEIQNGQYHSWNKTRFCRINL